MDQFMCYYCTTGGETLTVLVKHLQERHENCLLKVRTLELNVLNGKLGYRTHNFNIIPKTVRDKGQQISVTCEEPGSLALKLLGDEDENTRVFKSPLSKKVKKEEVSEDDGTTGVSSADFDADFHMFVDDEESGGPKEQDCMNHLIELLPSVLERLKEQCQLELWTKFHEMVSNGTFPLNNIAHLLFLDVVKWYSKDNSVCMRYEDQVTKFWRIGYRLFHGRFLRFMGGPKHKGRVLFGESARGHYSPDEALINFAVPSKKITDVPDSPLNFKQVQPGIIHPLLDLVAAQATEQKSYKICLDGKKINASTSGKLGDVDLFGFESEPTLAQRQNRLRVELSLLNMATEIVDNFDVDFKLNSMLPSISTKVCEKLKTVISILSEKIRDLRTNKVSKEVSLQKFKQMAGDDWKKSHLCNVISAISTHLYDINACINTAMRLADTFGYICALLSGSSSKFAESKTVYLRSQSNYRHLNDIKGHNFVDDTYRLLKQRSEEWFAVRSTAAVTGSTLNTAAGLDTLKAQQQHYDNVKFGKKKSEPSSDVRERMEHGSRNEINAVATLVSKVLPVFFPNLAFSEEGCIKKDANGTCIVVSPDGSCYDISTGNITMAVEIKCPFPPVPGTFKTPVYYKVAAYYVPQILAEMYALDVHELLFICYSNASTAVMRANFDLNLWKMLSDEINSVFSTESCRPVRKSTQIPKMKELIKEYIASKVTFLGEFTSVTAEVCSGRESTIDDPFCTHENQREDESDLRIVDMQMLLREAEQNINMTYQLNRAKASEFLGFMISDLDRMSSPAGLTAVPIAYGLKGYSLPTDTLRRMLEFVLMECEKAGLYVPVCSFDGQWSRVTVRDQDNNPLTILQLQKDVYQDVKKRPVSQLLQRIINRNVVRCTSFEEMSRVVDITRTFGKIVVGAKQENDRISISARIVKMIKDWKEGKHSKTKKSQRNDIDSSGSDILSSLPQNVVEEMSEKTMQDVLSVSTTVNPSPSTTIPHFEDIGESLAIAEDNCRDTQNPEPISQNSSDESGNPVLTESDTRQMLNALRQNEKTKKDWTILLPEFQQLFKDAVNINKSFTKNELLIATKPICGKLACAGIKIVVSHPKHQIVTSLCKVLGDGSELKAPPKRVKKSPPSLSLLTKAVLTKFPKDVLCSICASIEFPDKLEEWYHKHPFGKSVNIDGLNNTDCWYSMPEFNSCTGHYVFMVLDSYHQLCGTRRLVCQTGIPSRGIYRKAFVKIAQNSEQNGCELNLAMVNDLIDKQNAEFARATFSEKVSAALDDIGEHESAAFCRLLLNWYRAEDEPGISAIDRCKFRIQLKKWLLDGVSFCEFPPPGSFVTDIPVILFEGLLTNIERKIQLYTFAKRGTYNVRSVGSLDIENFFGTFQDIDPKGTGVLRPDDIPAALSVAMELMDAKLDSNRGFHMETTKSKVYPSKAAMDGISRSSITDSGDGIWRDLTTISPIDHEFDSELRARRKPKRKSALVSKPQEPAKGCMPVRQFHRRDESKILPHVRRGLNLTGL